MKLMLSTFKTDWKKINAFKKKKTRGLSSMAYFWKCKNLIFCSLLFFQFNLGEYVGLLFNKSIPATEKVVVYSTNYLSNLSRVIQSTNKE